MHTMREDPRYENVQTCHLFTALEAAMEIQKRKIVVGPSDSVGILLFNTVRISGLQIYCCVIQVFKGEEREQSQLGWFRAEEEYIPVSTYFANECIKNTRTHSTS